jgi:hypothetical protein
MKKLFLAICTFAINTAVLGQAITDNGTNVGIGNSTPTSKLDVNGSINLSAGNRITVGGTNALNMNGTRNIHIGENAGAISTGDQNAFIGYNAGQLNTTGAKNTFIGPTAGRVNTIGQQNSFIGGRAGFNNTTGSQNSFIGWQAGQQNVSGNENTFIGKYAGLSNTTGSLNTYIGSNAGGSATLTNATAIGAGAQVTASNSLVLGNNANVGIGTSAPSARLHVAGTTRLVDGTQGAGKVLTSDADGNASWQNLLNDNDWTINGGSMYNSSTNVGIGTSLPESRLHVIGNTSTQDVVTIVSGYTGNHDLSGLRVTAIPADGYGYGVRSVGGYYGVHGTGQGGSYSGTVVGVYGSATGTTGQRIGVFGTASGGSSNWAGWFQGDVLIGGNFRLANDNTAEGRILRCDANGFAQWVDASTIAAGPWLINGSAAHYPTGNVGIGITSPTRMLDVNGDAKINGLTIGRGGSNYMNNVAFGLDAFGVNSTGNFSIAIGYYALSYNTTGSSNTAIGSNALEGNNTGNDNIAVGRYTLANNTVGSRNTAIGFESSRFNGTANENTSVGYQAAKGQSGSSGQNAAFGAYALWGPGEGFSNTALGHSSMRSITNGYSNSAVGHSSLYSNTTGHSNAVLGMEAMRGNTSGNQNTASGYQSLYSNIGGNNNVALGYRSLYQNTTSDNVAIGSLSMFSTTSGSGNVAVGTSALSTNSTGFGNAAIGYQSLFGNTTGSGNAALGYRSLYSNQNGMDNCAMGYDAMYSNISGTNNVAIGRDALNSNTSGSNNVALGKDALLDNTTGSSNTAIGLNAMELSNGDLCTAVGFNALSFTNTGSANVALGTNALANNTSGYHNTVVGSYCGDLNSTGYHNSLFGFQTNVSSGNLDYASAIGAYASVNASDKVRLGTTTITVIEGQVAYSYPSDARFKENVKSNVPGLDFIRKLSPVTYNFNTEKYEHHLTQLMSEDTKRAHFENRDFSSSKSIVHSGLLAQEVEKVCSELGYDFDGIHTPDPNNPTDNYSIAYSQFIMPLIKAVQELDERTAAQTADSSRSEVSKEEFQQLKERNAKLENELQEIRSLLRSFEGDLQQCCFDHSDATGTSNGNQQPVTDSPRLEQNFPNPFHENTTIKYYLPSSTRTASITITDLNGVQLKTFDLSGGKGFGQVLISGGAFAAGTYIYTLTVNGKVVDSKRMVLL